MSELEEKEKREAINTAAIEDHAASE